MRQKLEWGAITRLLWTDTRDITADPHTKGSASRKPLHEVCGGVLWQRHASAELVLYGPKKGLHHVHQSGRHLTPGELAQSGRDVVASSDDAWYSAAQASAGPVAFFCASDPLNVHKFLTRRELGYRSAASDGAEEIAGA